MLELFNEQEYGFESPFGMQGKVIWVSRASEVAGEVCFRRHTGDDYSCEILSNRVRDRLPR